MLIPSLSPQQRISSLASVSPRLRTRSKVICCLGSSFTDRDDLNYAAPGIQRACHQNITATAHQLGKFINNVGVGVGDDRIKGRASAAHESRNASTLSRR